MTTLKSPSDLNGDMDFQKYIAGHFVLIYFGNIKEFYFITCHTYMGMRALKDLGEDQATDQLDQSDA